MAHDVRLFAVMTNRSALFLARDVTAAHSDGDLINGVSTAGNTSSMSRDRKQATRDCTANKCITCITNVILYYTNKYLQMFYFCLLMLIIQSNIPFSSKGYLITFDVSFFKVILISEAPREY